MILREKLTVGLAILLVVVGSIAYTVYSHRTPVGRELSAERAVIRKCRLAEHDPQQDARTRMAVAKTCEERAAAFEEERGSKP